MSINVTVSGNPVSIKRGKMVTCDPNHAKKEFEKRRLMRLEQVRQQSKDIAENVRNKVRREKNKQMSQIEQQGKEQVRNWQNRKLLELQTQYKEALRELGTGHKQAVELEAESEVLAEQKENNNRNATHRSQLAATQLQIEKNRENFKRSIPVQQKKIVRDIENTRASLVSKIKNNRNGVREPVIKRSKKRKKASADINITIPGEESDSEEMVELLDLENISEENQEEYGEFEEEEGTNGYTEESEEPREPLDMNKNNLASRFSQQEPPGDYRTGQGLPGSPPRREDTKALIELFRKALNEEPKQAPLDTRISDRIKRRELMVSQFDYCDTVAPTHPTPYIESNTKIRDTIESRYKSPGTKCPCRKSICPCGAGGGSRLTQEKSTQDKNMQEKSTQGNGMQERIIQGNVLEEEIPEKPPVRLKESLLSESSFSKIPSKSQVERIDADSIEVVPNLTSEVEWREKMKQRDKEARMRGQKALEKERVQKDYEDMMKKLPLLQKQERISQINSDKPEYHMSESRLQEKERKKQLQLDTAYNKLFPNKPLIVTLPSKKEEVKKLPDDEPIQSLNVGKWDVDYDQKMFTAEEVQQIVRGFTEKQKPKDRRAKLKELLRSLKLQKEQLLDEIKSLPRDDSINQLINDLNSFSDSDEKIGKSKSERKRRREGHDKEKEMSADATGSSSQEQGEKSMKSKGKSRSSHRFESTKTPSPSKKARMKSRRRVLILQNTSTQTTPKGTTSSNSDPEKQPKTQSEQVTCSKLHVTCDCNKENERSSEELCQILIKLKDKEDPEVVVKSKDKESVVSGTESQRSSRKVESKSVAVGPDKALKSLEKKVESGKVVTKYTQTSSVSLPGKEVSRKSSTAPKSVRDTTSESKSKSWKEQLSKNSISTTSTSYMSPPDFKKPEDVNIHTDSSDASKQSFYNLRKKPQQVNIHDISAAGSISQSGPSSMEKFREPSLHKYIKKLLNKSRESIENLTVSTSNVQTPSESVVEMESNNPMAQLHNIIKFINLKAEEMAQELSLSAESSAIHYNTTASPSEGTPQGSAVDVSVKPSATDGKGGSHSEKEPNVDSGRSKESLLLQYAEITDSCSRRIEALAAMINKIREEKIQMLKNGPGGQQVDGEEKLKTPDERDLSTKYLDLPGSKEGSSSSSSSRSINSLDEEELHKKLMEIDVGLAKKLRRFSPVGRLGNIEDVEIGGMV